MSFARSRKLIWVAILAAGSSYYYFDLFLPQVRAVKSANHLYGPYSFGGDLFPIWLTTRELFIHHRNPYSQELTAQIQTGIFGRPLDARNPTDPPVNYRGFSYPLYVDVLAAPSALVSFPTILAIGTLLLPLLAIASVALWFRVLNIPLDALTIPAVLTLVSYPVLEALYAQQPALVVSFLLAAAVAAMTMGKFIPAGISMALATVKPQLVLLLILAVLTWSLAEWRLRKSLALSFGLTLVSLLLTAYAVLPGWLTGWWRTLIEYRQYTEPPLAQLIFGKTAGVALSVLLLALTVWVCSAVRGLAPSSPNFAPAIAWILAVTVITLPSSVAVYDQVLLLPGVLWLYWYGPSLRQGSGPLRWLHRIAWLVLAWQWIASSAVAVAVLFLPNLRHNPFAISLPLRTAAALPFAMLAALGLSMITIYHRKRAAPTSVLST